MDAGLGRNVWRYNCTRASEACAPDLRSKIRLSRDSAYYIDESSSAERGSWSYSIGKRSLTISAPLSATASGLVIPTALMFIASLMITRIIFLF